MIDSNSIPAFLQTWSVEVLSGVVIATTFPFIAAHCVHAEHKFMQHLQGNPAQLNAGPESLTQPLNEFAKFFLREETIPENADKLLFWLAPLLSYAAAFIAIGALAVGPAFQAARDINIGLLFAIGVSSLSILGIILGACTSPNTAAILAATRSAVRLVSCQTAAAFALVSGALLAGTLKIRAIVAAQEHQAAWFISLAPIAFALYVVATLAETNRAPDCIQESHRYPRTLYSLAEFANRVVIAGLATTVFLGGWLRPFPNVHWLSALDFVPPLLMMLAAVHCARRAGKQGSRSGMIFMYSKALACLVAAILLGAPLLSISLRFLQPATHGAFWFLAKLITFLFFFTSVRFTLPRYRFENVMHFAWRLLIPLAIANTFFVAIALLLESEYRWNQWLATLLTTITILLVARLLWHWHEKRDTPATPNFAAVIATDSHGG
jgi:NADH-quinone oxidoreductase subunit H